MGVDDGLWQTRLGLGFGSSSSSPSLTLSLFEASNESGGASSVSNASVKRESVCEEDEDGSNGRKKLRLTKPQSALLEESFKRHTTLNPKQKQELARELKLRPRQVEVWFQNRRARTKLKQTEVECELLKKCCETLSDENRRLQKELQALKLAPPLFMPLPMCPTCSQRIAADNASKPHFYNPSAAC